MSDNIIPFPDSKSLAPADPPAQTPHDGDEPMSAQTHQALTHLSERVISLSEAQAKALQMIMGDHAFVCISMGPDGTGGGADIRTAVGGDRAMIKAIANGSNGGLHGVLTRLLEREDLIQ